MRLDRPIGTWLLLLPALWSIMLAIGMTSQTLTQTFIQTLAQTLTLIVLFSLGAVVMRGAGCVINDLWDQDLDSQVERTKTRPLASGVISRKQAFVFLAMLLSIRFCILIQLPALTIGLGFVSLGFVVLYPLMKRITWWPQAFLGLTFNFGALMGGSAVTGTLTLSSILLYIGGIFWTLGYDTIYACQDKEDDALVGIKSTARLFGTNTKRWIAGFYVMTTLCFLGAVFVVYPDWRVALCLPAFLIFVFQIKAFEIDDPQNCLKQFKQHRNFGLTYLVGICMCQSL